MSQTPSIIYTWTDEAPALATHAFLRVIRFGDYVFLGESRNRAEEHSQKCIREDW